MFDIITPLIFDPKTISAISFNELSDKSGSIFIKIGTLSEYFLFSKQILLTNWSKLSFSCNSLNPGVFGEESFNVF